MGKRSSLRPSGARVAIAALAALAFAPAVLPAQPAPQAESLPVYKDASQPVEQRIDDLLARMTLEEKVAQMISVWEQKKLIQTADGAFSPEQASRREVVAAE